MIKSKLNNLLDFNEYDKLSCCDLKKPTKRTEIGGDILKEHHKTSVEGKLAYIINNLSDASPEMINSVYNMLEGEIV